LALAVLAGCSEVFGGSLGRRASPNQAIITDNCNIFTRSATLPGIKFNQSNIRASGLVCRAAPKKKLTRVRNS
jgi:hypothetical protein